MSHQELEQFDSYEALFSFEDLRHFRSRARADYSTLVKKKVAEGQKQQPTSAGRGGYIWSFFMASKSSDQEQKRHEELCKIIGYDGGTASEAPSSDALKLRIIAVLNKGSLILRKKSEDIEILSVIFDTARATLVQRVANLEAIVSLSNFGVYERTSGASMYRQIVRLKSEKVSAGPNPDKQAIETIDHGASDPLFFFKFVHHPLGGHSDSAITVRTKALEVVYHKDYVEAIVAFFRTPASQLESVSALLVSLHKAYDQMCELIGINSSVGHGGYFERASHPQPGNAGIRFGEA